MEFLQEFQLLFVSHFENRFDVPTIDIPSLLVDYFLYFQSRSYHIVGVFILPLGFRCDALLVECFARRVIVAPTFLHHERHNGPQAFAQLLVAVGKGLANGKEFKFIPTIEAIFDQMHINGRHLVGQEVLNGSHYAVVLVGVV